MHRLVDTHTTIAWLLALLGLYWFASSFFLAKRSLVHRSTCNEAPDLLQNVLGLTASESQFLVQTPSSGGILSQPLQSPRMGCWMPRQVDSMVIVVVDALRFDFALYNLPNSIGRRLHLLQTGQQQAQQAHPHYLNSTSRLLQFVADAPTVTMQRLKALTTGGLPTFADISANFGGATVEEDSWIQMLSGDSEQNTEQQYTAPWQNRGLSSPPKTGFVGDDTWLDLFPHAFTEAHPYPSFNTRDLNTVDNGCLQHLPYFLSKLRTRTHHEKDKDDTMEVVVVHFLGVDHAGHTYGPHNEHMDRKLRQMDAALTNILETLDKSKSCHSAFIFGDHGMTPDGNHGGGTEEEINAALFVHASPACRREQHENGVDGSSNNDLLLLSLEKERSSDLVPPGSIHQAVFGAIRQIDIVPTISIMLGLPIPFANLGSVVPSLLLPPLQQLSNNSSTATTTSTTTLRQVAATLALNAAQVWRYFTIYSATASTLPNLDILEQDLQLAVSMYKQALAADDAATASLGGGDDDLYLQAATLFKVFLQKALDLGQRVWTRFDLVGMAGGVIVLTCGLGLFALPLLQSLLLASQQRVVVQSSSTAATTTTTTTSRIPRSQYAEIFLALLFMTFQCGALTFGNSYILEEERSAMYCLAVLSMAVAMRLYTSDATTTTTTTTNNSASISSSSSSIQPPPLWLGMLLLPMASRIHELAVSGHGMDPSIHAHGVHHAVIFLSSIAWLAFLRVFVVYRYQKRRQQSLSLGTQSSLLLHTVADCLTLLALAGSWWEKRHHRNGYGLCRVALGLLFVGIPIAMVQDLVRGRTQRRSRTDTRQQQQEQQPEQQSRVNSMNNLLTIMSKVLIAIMAVTGPSTAATMVLYTLQAIILSHLAGSSSISSSQRGKGGTSTTTEAAAAVSPLVLAALWKLTTRHVFFATNHACAFNRLQYSAAFIATSEFYFGTGGVSLFLNTFGWEVAGLGFCWILGLVQQQQQQQEQQASKSHCIPVLWKVYGLYQLLEALASCISVSVLRRHLMVWDIYAPHFLFVAIFTVLTGLTHLTASTLLATSP